MPIGNSDTEFLWEKVYYPVIQNCGFDPDRIDWSEDGSHLPDLIFQKIKHASLIIADLTLERPNCYFELGYAFAEFDLDAKIIICCREDHNHDSDNYQKNGPKVHFDLQGRHITWWDKNDLNEFKKELELKINRRMEQIKKQQREPETETSESIRRSDTPPPDDNRELEKRLKKAQEEFANHG